MSDVKLQSVLRSGWLLRLLWTEIDLKINQQLRQQTEGSRKNTDPTIHAVNLKQPVNGELTTGLLFILWLSPRHKDMVTKSIKAHVRWDVCVGIVSWLTGETDDWFYWVWNMLLLVTVSDATPWVQTPTRCFNM